MKKYLNSRLGWSQFFAKRFNKTGSDRTAHLALWYLILHLGLDPAPTNNP